ncbi:MAG: hypothetical protein QOH97_5304 [Actinoplanes sp.]|jgi:hypothetical protein|nr:hypothetical protein [Actinoplanes sp.]
MAKNNKVATYRTGDGRTAMTGVTDKQVKQLREAGRLESVRRVRLRGL